MTAPLLAVEGVSKRFGAFQALDDVSLVLRAGERLGIIGPNGSGKTTLINCITGVLACDAGRILFDGRDVGALAPHRRARLGMARSFQIPQPFTGMTVAENLKVVLDYHPHAEADAARIAAVLASVGLSARADAPAESLSQLELRKLELARALIARPRLLIADEAMAGLSEGEIDEVLAILRRLADEGVAVIMIEHIMHAVMGFSERVLCFETGRLIAEGPPAAITRDATVQRVYFGESAAG